MCAGLALAAVLDWIGGPAAGWGSARPLGSRCRAGSAAGSGRDGRPQLCLRWGFGLPWRPGASSRRSLFPCPWENPACPREGRIIKRDCDKRAGGGSDYHLVSHFQVLFGNSFSPLFFNNLNFILVEFAVGSPLAGLFAGTSCGSTSRTTLLAFPCCQHLGLGWSCWSRLCWVSFIDSWVILQQLLTQAQSVQVFPLINFPKS